MTILKNSNCIKIIKKKNAVVIVVTVVTVLTVVTVETIVKKKKKICHIFLAALSSSTSLVVGPLVGLSVGDVCEKVSFRVSKGN